MSETTCPGGAHPKPEGDLCCDPCWKRVPTNLPGHTRWRTELRNAHAINAWVRIERIHDAVLAWLRTHPKKDPRWT